MSRSLKKGPFCCPKLLKKVLGKLSEAGQSRVVIKTWSRASTILPVFLGMTFMVHNGREFMPVFVTEGMIGFKLGEFVMTRTFRGHSGDRKN